MKISFFLLMENLGKGRVYDRFNISEKRYEEIRKSAKGGEAINPEFIIDVVDDEGNVLATVEKVLYIKKKNP